MKIKLLTIILISTFNLKAQDKVKNEIADLWWNNEIEIINNSNKSLSYDEAIYVINSQNVSTNCWSSFYRHTQNIQQSSSEQIIYNTLKNCEIIEKGSREFKVINLVDPETGRKKETELFSFKLIDSKEYGKERNNKLDNFLNKKLKISKLIFKDVFEQFIDECHEKYSIQFSQDGTFEQGFGNQIDCNCKINLDDFNQIKQIGFVEFNEANHSLLGLNGKWKIVSNILYLKFSSGNIFRYTYEVKESKLMLEESWTTIELKVPADNK